MREAARVVIGLDVAGEHGDTALGAKPSSVRSSNEVLPEPGELIRFRQNTPWF